MTPEPTFSAQLLTWLLNQVPAIVIAGLVILWMTRLIAGLRKENHSLQLRNDLLSDRLVDVVQKASDERLQLTQLHHKERLNTQTDHLLQHDATLRSIMTSLEQGLLTKLAELDR